MFIRRTEPRRRSNVLVLAVVGAGLIVIGGVLIGLAAIGLPLPERAQTYLVILPPVGVVLLIASLVSYLRHRRD